LAKPPTERESCGSWSAYYWHREHGEDPCEACSTGALMAWSAKHMAELMIPGVGARYAERARAAFFEKRVEATS
jgi:hypothetical protein